MRAPKQVNLTEFTWFEKGYGRDAMVATGAVTGGNNQIILPVTAASLGIVTINTIVSFPNDQIGNITAINKNSNQVTVQMQTGAVAPNVNANDLIANKSSIEPDGVNNYSQNFRIQTIKRVNFIQQFVKGMTFADYELEKYKRSGTTDFLEVNKMEFVRQFRIDISNTMWGGVLGQIDMSYGEPAKTSDGIYSLMTKNASPIAYTTLASVGSALESIALQTEYGYYGDVKFAFMTPTMKNAIAKYYKYPLLRYTVTTGDSTADGGGGVAPLSLEAVDIGSTRIILVPYKRFEDTASFSTSWQNRIFLLDVKNITPCYFMPESMIQTPNRRTGINLKTYTNFVMSADFSMEFNNPASSGLVIVQ